MAHADVISDHEVRIYRQFSSQPERWFTNSDLAVEAHVAARTARQHTRRFTDMKLLHEAQVFPGFRYRWTKSKVAYVEKLTAPSQVLEIYDTRSMKTR
jgi:hypothetical protein